MEIKVFQNNKEISFKIINDLNKILSKKINPLICIAAGETTIPIMKSIVKASSQGELQLKDAKFISLDEWEGIGKETQGSCAQTLYDNLYIPLGVSENNICFFNGNNELENEVTKINQFIKENDGIDYIILGVGMNGHVGFNEPNIKQLEGALIVDLDETTTSVMKKYFNRDYSIKRGVTLSLNQILQARQIVLVITGEHKHNIVKKTIEIYDDPGFPVSMLKGRNNNLKIYLDQDVFI